MVDHSNRMYVQQQNCHQKGRLSVQQATKIEVVMARSYSDDTDICRGALSAPRNHFRPGQRDDVPNPTIVAVVPMM
jgi:hypothetical protein